MKKLFIFVLLLQFFSSPLISQEKAKDSTFYKKHKNYNLFGEEFFYSGRPTIDISYGQTNFSFKNSGLTFPDYGIVETKLGYGYLGKTVYSKNIVRYRNRFLFGSMLSNSLSISKENNNTIKTWRFGFGTEEGYGYKIGKKSSIVLYNAGTINWTRYDDAAAVPTEENPNPPPGGELFDFYQTFRFGTSMEAGLLIPVGNLLNFKVMYDRSVIFPRHLFWKHLGSAIIEGIGQTAIDGFVRAIMHTSPGAGPIVSFILKNGFAYGLYELRKENMNWPFETAEPLFNESFKVGLTFIF